MSVLFRGKPALKDELIERAVEHRKADRIVHDGQWFYQAPLHKVNPLNNEPNGWRGCAIGCLATAVGKGRWRPRFLDRKSAIERLSRRYGIPSALTALAEAVFEATSANDNDLRSRRWPERFARAIPVGVELTTQDIYRFVARTPSVEGWDDLEIQEQTPAADALVRWLRSLDSKEAA